MVLYYIIVDSVLCFPGLKALGVPLSDDQIVSAGILVVPTMDILYFHGTIFIIIHNSNTILRYIDISHFHDTVFGKTGSKENVIWGIQKTGGSNNGTQTQTGHGCSREYLTYAR